MSEKRFECTAVPQYQQNRTQCDKRAAKSIKNKLNSIQFYILFYAFSTNSQQQMTQSALELHG